MCVLVYMNLCALCAFRSLWRPEEGIRFSGARVIGTCEPLCGCWELTSSLLPDQQKLLTMISPVPHAYCKNNLKNSRLEKDTDIFLFHPLRILIPTKHEKKIAMSCHS